MDPVTLTVEPDAIDDRPLRLAPPQEEHLDGMARLLADSDTIRWTMAPDPWTAQDRANYVDRAASQWAEGGARWAILDSQDRFLGTVGLRPDYPGEAGIVYQTVPEARGRGVALRAAHRAAAFGFDELGLQRLNWEAIVGHHVSRLIALRLGFGFEGIARSGAVQRDRRVDLWIGGMLPGELRALDDLPPRYSVERARAATFAAGQPELAAEIAGLTLRPVREHDLDAVYRACQDEEFQRWTTIPRPYERRHADGFLQNARQSWALGTKAVFALADDADRYCGAVDLRLGAMDDPDAIEVGFNTVAWARGRGFMTAALRRLSRFCFEELEAQRLVWRAMVGNEASKRVAEKAGFTMEGVARAGLADHDGRPDGWIASLLKGDVA